MNNLRTMSTLVLAMMVSACGDDGTSLDTVGLEGTWRASAIVYTSAGNSQNQVDIVQRDGASFTLTVDAEGTATSVFVDGVGGTSSDSGTLDASATTLTLGGRTFDADRDGDVLTLVDPDAQFDFGTGSEVAATLHIVLRR
ncbi:MAG: hypothetical protein RJQ04_05775 [Longimicrobiales bacterium]